MDKTKIILIGIIVLLILGIIIYFTYQKINTNCNLKIYNQSITYYNQGQLDIIKQINTDGKIPVLSVQNNQTKLDWKSINDICGGK